MGKLLPVCLVCKKTPDQGIGEGLFINNQFICELCEREIVNLTSGSDRYDYILHSLKSIWV
ncbi:MAG: sigma factor G inhibitor Gin [Thermoanaerobacteraceae bacterium]|nr:sigma factor G inhibitor Gin [Thermoanaerobacteraceae bacterium]